MLTYKKIKAYSYKCKEQKPLQGESQRRINMLNKEIIEKVRLINARIKLANEGRHIAGLSGLDYYDIQELKEELFREYQITREEYDMHKAEYHY